MEDDIENIELKPASMRKTFTLRNNVARQAAVNFMPSRKMAYSTLRLRRVSSEHNALLEASMSDAPDAAEKQADIIVREMEQHLHLMEDNPLSEELRRTALRDLPQGLTIKRTVRAKLSASVSLRSKRRPISMFKRMKYRISFAWKKSRDHFRDFIFSIELWYEAIRNIEGHLGSAVGSYFHLLRWLFVLNLMLSVFLISFLIVPQTLHDNGRNGTDLKFVDFISGLGGLEDTLLFYGHYHDGIISTGPLQYNMPFAYFFTMGSLYLMFFAVLCYRTADSYRRNFIEPAGGGGGGGSAVRAALATKLFCGWDFGIATPRAAGLASRALYYEFRELLNEQNKKQEVSSIWTKIWQRFTNIAITIIVLAVISGILYGLWMLLSVETLTSNREIYVSLIITAVTAVCPILLHFIVKLEYYTVRTAFYVTLARTWLLDVGILMLLLVFWVRSDQACWETSIGQEGYRLVVLDVPLSLFLLPAVELVRGLLFHYKYIESPPEFNIAYNSLTLIYNQSVLWFGMVFSPLLVIAVTVKFLILFYVKRETALRACQTGKKKRLPSLNDLGDFVFIQELDGATTYQNATALRDLPQGLTIKRTVRAKLSASVSLRSKRRPISMFKRMKYRISFAWKKSRDHFRDFIFSIELWYEAIRNIEGHLGSAVGSYFHLLRWLFVLNLMLSVFLISFLIVPQTLHDNGRNGTDLKFVDFISGLGGLEDTLLFYGHYHDGIISTGPLQYNMPFAYFFTMGSLYLMFFAVLCYRTADSYRRNFIEPAGGGGGGGSAVRAALATKLFCGWDFGIATPRAAGLASRALYYEFRELLNEQNKKQEVSSIWTKIWQRFTNIAITIIVLAVISGILYGLWMLLSVETLTSNREIYVSLIITAVTAVCPILLHFIVKLEYYTVRTAFYVTLARTWLLDVGILMLLLVFWVRSDQACWETSIGQEGYRLVVLDVPLSLFLLPAVELVRGLLFHYKYIESPPEFNIAYNSLTLIYNQSVLWFGMVFSPLLVIAVTVKFLILFYVKRETALRACQTGKKVWRAAQTQTVLHTLVTLSLFTTLFALGSLFLRSSSSCGPFRSYDYVYEVLSEGALRLSEHSTLSAVLHFFTRPGSIAFVLLALCVSVYIARARAGARRSMARLLRHMLRLQAKDKDFLLAAIEKVSNGEWLYSPKAEDYGADSHTWKYLNEVRKPSNAGYHFDASRLSHSFLDRPRSYVKETRPTSYVERQKSNEDGDTDSSFSWQGSSSYLNQNDVEKR